MVPDLRQPQLQFGGAVQRYLRIWLFAH